MITILNSRWFIWILLALPSIRMVMGVIDGSMSPHAALHPTGEFAVRGMVLAMLFSPLVTLFPRVRFFRWLLARRRYFGLAAFGYATLHTLYYLVDTGSVSAVAAEAFELGIWTGWLAFFIFVPMAITSNDASMRKLGRRWKTLQRFVYAAAILSAAHWLFIEWHWTGMLTHFVPLAVLEAARVIKLATLRRQPAPA